MPSAVPPHPGASSPEVSARMSVAARRDTAPEVALRRALHAAGYRFRVVHPVPGNRRRSIDIAFTRAKIAVFVDGCFWHGCPEHGTQPRANGEWWTTKLATNKSRDEDTDRLLREAGWRVIRIWEHEDVETALAVVSALLEQPPTEETELIVHGPDDLLAAASVDEEVLALRPDYRALLVVVAGITPAASDEASEELLVRAEGRARDLLAETPVEQLPHVEAWRAAYRAFGAKPQRTRNSLEALTRRAPDGLPRVNRLTDVYNAVSVLHQVPVGGEDLDRYAGPPRLARAAGDEAFDTAAGGEPVVEHPEPGEVVWRDDVGVTCRRWNWRQARRTQLTDDTATALFILDALEPMTTEALHAAADDLVGHLSANGAPVRSWRRLVGGRETTAVEG